jgi:hypothetical protein
MCASANAPTAALPLAPVSAARVTVRLLRGVPALAEGGDHFAAGHAGGEEELALNNFAWQVFPPSAREPKAPRPVTGTRRAGAATTHRARGAPPEAISACLAPTNKSFGVNEQILGRGESD